MYSKKLVFEVEVVRKDGCKSDKLLIVANDDLHARAKAIKIDNADYFENTEDEHAKLPKVAYCNVNLHGEIDG